MSAQYDLYETPDIKQTGEKQPLHPRIVPKGTIDQNEFLDRVHKFTGISRSLLAGAMQSFQNELKDLLANGWIVELGEIGYFSLSLQGPPVMNKKDVRAQSIKLKNINYLPTKQFKREVGYDLRLERTESITRPKGNRRSEAECLTLIAAHLEKYPCMTRTDYCRMTGHDKKRALKELNGFIDKGILMRYGAGKQIVYAQVKKKSQLKKPYGKTVHDDETDLDEIFMSTY